MGSWNGTCMLSSLPILEDDKIKIIILSKVSWSDSNFSMNGCCYTTDEFQIMSPVLDGIYNDYGRFKLTNEKDIKELEYIESLCKINEEEQEETFIDNLERGNVTYNGDRVAFIMIHKDIYDKLMKEELRKWTNNEIIDYNDGKMLFEYYSKSLVFSSQQLVPIKSFIKNNFSKILKYGEVSKFNDILGLMRKRFYLPSGCGSQDTDYKYQQLLAKYILEQKSSRIEEED